MKRKIRALAMLLALALILSLSGMTASADEDGIVAYKGYNTSHAAVTAWQNNSATSYEGKVNLNTQQFFIADFKESLSAEKYITGIQFSANNAISGYVGYYILGPGFSGWTRLITEIDYNTWEYSYVNKVMLDENAPVNVAQVSTMFTNGGNIYIGFAVDGPIEDNTTVTISTMSNEEEIESHSFEFTANSTTPDPSPTTIPVETIRLHRLVTENNEPEKVGDECTEFTLVVGNEQYDEQPGSFRLSVVIAPENANQNVTWTIKDNNQGTDMGINEYNNHTAAYEGDFTPVVTAVATGQMATIKGIKPGVVTLTATSDDNPEKKASCVITILDLVHATTNETTKTFANLLYALADSDTTTGTSFTFNSEAAIAGIKVPADSDVSVVDVETQSKGENGAVTAKEVNITSGSTTNKVYVVTDGSNSVAIKSNSVTVDSDTITGENKPVTSYINVTKTLAKAVAAMTAPINKITGVELSLKLTDAADSAPSAVTENVESPTFVCEVHPETTVFYNDGTDGGAKATYAVPNENLAEGASFPVSLTGLDDSKTYTIYHYAADGTLKKTYTKERPNGGKITLQLSSFSYLLGVANETSTPEIVNNKVNSVYRTYMNLQTNLFLNYQLYLTADTSSADYAQDGKLALSYDGNKYEIDLKTVGAHSESAMRIGVATNGYYCGRYYYNGQPTPWYYVTFGVFPNKMNADCTVKVLKADGSETALYRNTNAAATGISSAVLDKLINNVYSTTVNAFEDSLIGSYSEGSVDYALAQQVKAYGAAAAAVFVS